MARTRLTFHLIPHTHWDREWYLPRAGFQARLVPMLDELFQRLDHDPRFGPFLLDGQTVLVEDYLRALPGREPLVAALVRAGRLQVGPWYVLADELIPSGESLIRNLLGGAADAAKLGGRSEALYSPDAFGHPAALPLLARGFGLTAGVLWRGLGGEPGQERDLFRWGAPDGSTLLLWHLPPEGYEIGAALPGDPLRLPSVWDAIRGGLVARAATSHIAVFVGADHHGVHPDLPELRERLAVIEPHHDVRVSRLDEFLRAVSAEAPHPPTISGELRWSYRYTWTLQGVHGTRAPLKRRHGRAELWLERVAEPLAALASWSDGRDRRPVLDLAWRTLLRTQFHDTLCGCSSDVVARAAAARLDSVDAYAAEIADAGANALAGHDPDAVRDEHGPAESGLWLWNAAARPRGGVVVADLTWFRRDVLVGPPGGRVPRRGKGAPLFALHASDGAAIPVQVLSRRITLERRDAGRHYPDQDEVEQLRVAFRAPPVSGLGALVLRPGAPAGAPVQGVEVRGKTIRNRFIEVTIDSGGGVTLTDRQRGQHFTRLLRLEDSGDAGDLYTYCPPMKDRVTVVRKPATVRRLAAGPLVASLECRYSLGSTDVRLVLVVHADSSVVRCLLDVTNRSANHRLRLRCSTGLAGAPAVAGAAFGSVVRASVGIRPADFPREIPVATAPAQRFVAAAREGRGLALFAPGFFEYEWTARGDLLVTVLRAVGELSRADLPTRPGHAGWPMATPEAQCLGRDRVELALAPVTPEDLARGDRLPALWEDTFLPLRGRWMREAGALSPSLGATLDGSGLVFSAAKPAQVGPGLVLRCFNATGTRVGGAWRFGRAVRSAHRVRLDETTVEGLVIEDGHTVRFLAGPHEVVTVRVT
jgi:mannosylglycerate hydrolase